MDYTAPLLVFGIPASLYAISKFKSYMGTSDTITPIRIDIKDFDTRIVYSVTDTRKGKITKSAYQYGHIWCDVRTDEELPAHICKQLSKIKQESLKKTLAKVIK